MLHGSRQCTPAAFFADRLHPAPAHSVDPHPTGARLPPGGPAKRNPPALAPALHHSHPTGARLSVSARPATRDSPFIRTGCVRLPPRAPGETQPIGTRRIRLPAHPGSPGAGARRAILLPRGRPLSRPRPDLNFRCTMQAACLRFRVLRCIMEGHLTLVFRFVTNKGVCESSAPPFSLSGPGLEWNAFFS